MNGREKEVPGVRKQFCAPVCPPTHIEKGKQGDSGPHRPTDRPTLAGGEGNEEKEEAMQEEGGLFFILYTRFDTQKRGEAVVSCGLRAYFAIDRRRREEGGGFPILIYESACRRRRRRWPYAP